MRPEFLHSRSLPREPLLRLLIVNLAGGIGAATIMLAGLLLLNPHRLRDLIFSDSSGAVAAGLLLFGLVITFGSVAMGSAIMALGKSGFGGGGSKRKHRRDRAAETEAILARVK